MVFCLSNKLNEDIVMATWLEVVAGIAVGGIGAAVVISAVAGARSYTQSTGQGGGVDNPDDPCGGCRDAKKWWDSLSGTEQAAFTGWYAYKRLRCRASGCSFSALGGRHRQ